jgi:hypothetical protein
LGGAARNDSFSEILTFSQISLSSTFYKSYKSQKSFLKETYKRCM